MPAGPRTKSVALGIVSADHEVVPADAGEAGTSRLTASSVTVARPDSLDMTAFIKIPLYINNMTHTWFLSRVRRPFHVGVSPNTASR
jgi:hypothetical protein